MTLRAISGTGLSGPAVIDEPAFAPGFPEYMYANLSIAASFALVAGCNTSGRDITATKATAVCGIRPAAGESMLIDVGVSNPDGASAGVTILAGPVTIDSTTPLGAIDLPLADPPVVIPDGCVLEVTGVYTAGGGAAPMGALSVRIDLPGRVHPLS